VSAASQSEPSKCFAPMPVPEIVLRLRAVYGDIPWRPHGDAVTELVLTILSQHTADTNSGRAFANLLVRFADWDAIREAALEDVVAATRAAGLSTTKAPRIQAVLRKIRDERGSYDLSFLADLPLEDARAWLTGLPGVGPKTAACVLMFALGRPALPVDTHVYRVAKRLGLLAPKATAAAAHQILEAMVPAELMYEFHVGLIKHGRHVCRALQPACAACVLSSGCPSAFKADASLPRQGLPL
jgi:endonuclease-3